ncbi:PREDICTED: uncharacterized protein LOC109215545 [Nicotiana attenuata]|uniref:uncharacterized protein LOC109215545 n=1 Tax=Nicotiana attenuata TaxID=49451 RepID=UPI0009057315|nr:PREDICTED: uncharacterized protein LOC109215545 [Nicotiana attenuata]
MGEENETNVAEKGTQTEVNTQQENQEVQIQIGNRGKQAMIYHGKSNTKNQPTIDYEELTRRNKYATLRIQENEPPDQQGGCLETRVKQRRAKDIQKKFGRDWKVIDNYNDAPNGRIWLCWKGSTVNVDVKQITSQMIHCHLKDKNSEFQSDVTIVYGLHTIADRRDLWNQLRDISARTNDPWLIIGDFNSVLSVEDRINWAPVHQNEVVNFKQCLSDIGVGLINKKRMQFSWSNKRGAEERIYSHIDWAFGNADWFGVYAGIEAVYLVPGCSDHTPIILNTEVQRMKMRKPYRLLNVMLQQEEYKTAVKNIWRQNIQGCTMYAICRKLKLLEQQTRGIQRRYSSVEEKLKQMKEELKRIQQKLNENLLNPQLIEQEKEILRQMEKWDAVHEKVLRQKSRAIWINHGDSNIKYFHAQLKARQARNRVTSICTERNERLTEPLQIQQEFIQFFKKLLGESTPVMPGIDVNIIRDGPCLSMAQQQQMIRPVTEE